MLYLLALPPQVTHPFLPGGLSLDTIRTELHTAFLLASVQPPSVTLKGQMVLTKHSGERPQDTTGPCVDVF